MSPQEFAAAWGPDRYCLPPDILEGVDIPEDAKTFLVEAGLPLPMQALRGPYAIPQPLVPASSPFQADKYPLLSRYLSTPFRLLACRHESEALGLGDAHSLYYAIEEGTGHIYEVGPGLESRPEQFVNASIFVNTSIARFAEFLLCYREFTAQFRLYRPQKEPPFRSLKQQWQAIDSGALTDPDYYWVMAYYDIMECF